MIIALQVIFGLSVAGILVLAFRKIPVLLNYPRSAFERASLKEKIWQKLKDFRERTAKSDFLHEEVIPKTDKFLRKFSIIILKLHNLLTKISGHLRKKKCEKEAEDNGDLNPPS